MLASYRFSGESCSTVQDTSSSSSLLGALTGANLDCTAVDGVVEAGGDDPAPFISDNTVASMRTSLTASGGDYSLEFWISQSSNTDFNSAAILAIEDPNPVSGSGCEHSLRIKQFATGTGGKIQVLPCATLDGSISQPVMWCTHATFMSGPTHVVITQERDAGVSSTFKIYISGVNVKTNVFDYDNWGVDLDPTTWEDSNVLKVLGRTQVVNSAEIGTGDSLGGWNGRIYALNMHNSVLSDSEVASLNSAGLPGLPTMQPTPAPTTAQPSFTPTLSPTPEPSYMPTAAPSEIPTVEPSLEPTPSPSHVPTAPPSFSPTESPSHNPTFAPTLSPTESPTYSPTAMPTYAPSEQPSYEPSHVPTVAPTVSPTEQPSPDPSEVPTPVPTVVPSEQPTENPTVEPSFAPTTAAPTFAPSASPTQQPTVQPSEQPTVIPTAVPSLEPSPGPTEHPTVQPSFSPSESPTEIPTVAPTMQPTKEPTVAPTEAPTMTPTEQPTVAPTVAPTMAPTMQPTKEPTEAPTMAPTVAPTEAPTVAPTEQPTKQPTLAPTVAPTEQPTVVPSEQPSEIPTMAPTMQPTEQPSQVPTVAPSPEPSFSPSEKPSASPTVQPTRAPSHQPTHHPTMYPTQEPTVSPSLMPTMEPTFEPSHQPSLEPSMVPTWSPSQAPASIVSVTASHDLTSTATSEMFMANTAAVTAFESAVAGYLDVSESNVIVDSVSESSGESRRLEDMHTISVIYTVELPVDATEESAGIAEAMSRVSTAVADPSFSSSLSSSLSAVPDFSSVQVLGGSTISSIWTGDGLQGSSEVLVSFEMASDECLAGHFSDGSSDQLLGTLDAQSVTCLDSYGVRAGNSTSVNEAIVSTEPVGALANAMGQDFSIEMWLRLGDEVTTAAEHLIFAIPVEDPYACLSGYPNSFSISHGGGDLYLQVFSCRDYINECFLRRRIPDVPLTEATHVVVTENQGTFSVWINGEQVAQRALMCDLANQATSPHHTSTWFPGAQLKLFVGDESSLEPRWPGTLHMLAVHGNALGSDEIASRHTSSFPNSRPVATDTLLTIKENGEDGDHSLDPEFYDSPIPATELVPLVLEPWDFDDLSDSPLYDVNVGPRVRLHLMTLPEGGTLLYHHDGTLITDVPIEVPRDGNNMFSVRVRPPLDEVSTGEQPLFSFTYIAEDGVQDGFLSETATVSVIVQNVNKPPVPHAVSSVHPVVPRVTTLLSVFSGDDSDGTVEGAGIATLPAHGDLYDVAVDGTISTLPLSLPSDGTAFALHAFKVAYVHTGTQSGSLDSVGEFAQDSFFFVVIDNEGLPSRREVYPLSLRTALNVVPTSASELAPAAIQDVPSLLTLHAVDLSKISREIRLRVVVMPSHGTLYTAQRDADGVLSMGAAITYSSLIPMTGGSADDNGLEHSTEVYYVGTVFSVPSTTAGYTPEPIPSALPDVIEYEVLSLDGALSLSDTQSVHVRNLNERSDITFTVDTDVWPDGNIEIHALSMSSDNVPSEAVLTGFDITDPDLGADSVHVQVLSHAEGKISLSAEALPHLEFTGASCVLPRWECRGSGDTDTRMDFVATPAWAMVALNGMKYRNTREYVQDNVTVQIWDGEGGNCKDTAQLSTSVFNTKCYHSMASFTVNVISFAPPPSDEPESGGAVNSASFLFDLFQDQLLSIGILLLVCLVVCRVCCVSTRKIRRKYCCGGKNVPPSPNTMESASPRKNKKVKKLKAALKERKNIAENDAIAADGVRNPFEDSSSDEGTSATEDASASDTESTTSMSSIDSGDKSTSSSIHYTGNPCGDLHPDLIAQMTQKKQSAVQIASKPPPPPPKLPSWIEPNAVNLTGGAPSRLLLNVKDTKQQPPPPPPRSAAGRTIPNADLALNAAAAFRHMQGEHEPIVNQGHAVQTAPLRRGSGVVSIHGMRMQTSTQVPQPQVVQNSDTTTGEECTSDDLSIASSFTELDSNAILSNGSSPASLPVSPNPLSADSLQRAHQAAAVWRHRPSWVRRPSRAFGAFLSQSPNIEEDAEVKTPYYNGRL